MCSAVRSAKFIAREHWLVAGDDEGWVHVYAYNKYYTTKEKVVIQFIAHRERLVDLLAVHPTRQFLLTASSSVGTSIKLWDWDQEWICTQTFDTPHTKLLHLCWNPRDSNGFASISNDCDTLKLWNIKSSDAVTTMEGMKRACYLYANTERHIMVTTSHQQNNHGKRAFIWDLQTKECVHRLGLSGWDIYDIACHPTHPILATTHSDGSIVCLWDTMTYRLETIVKLRDRHIPGMIFFSSTKEFTRLVISCFGGISTMEIKVSTIDTDGGN